MGKYIDAEWLKAVYEIKPKRGEAKGGHLIPIPFIYECIEKAPTIDICFCCECKHNYNTAINHGKMQPRCDFTDRKLTENDFCSRGEREGE